MDTNNSASRRRDSASAAFVRQQQVAALLQAMDRDAIAVRLQECGSSRTARSRHAWPWTCRSPGCAWCGPRLATRWWRGLQRWAMALSAPAMSVTLAVPPGPIVGVAPRFRRALRDVRDRAARADRRWATVSIAGMVDAEGHLHLLLLHPDLSATAVERVMARRWPQVRFQPSCGDAPPFAFTPRDAASLARVRRGVEPLRVVVLGQRLRHRDDPKAGEREPMPLVFA